MIKPQFSSNPLLPLWPLLHKEMLKKWKHVPCWDRLSVGVLDTMTLKTHCNAGTVSVDTAIPISLINNLKKEVVFSLFDRWQARALEELSNSSRAIGQVGQSWDFYPRLDRIWFQTWTSNPSLCMTTFWASVLRWNLEASPSFIFSTAWNFPHSWPSLL